MSKIIFVEGVSGVGKSTMTQKIYDKLSGQGFTVNRWLEFDFPNPIDFYCTAYFKLNDYARLLTEYSDYSNDIKDNTVIAGDIRLVRYYNRKMPLFAEPLLEVLRKHEFCFRPSNLVPMSEYTRVYRMVWEKFVQETPDSIDFLIFDGSLFHHPINDLRLNYSASCDDIVCHLNLLLKSVDTLTPRVIYLSSDNVAERLRKARISREETPPTTEQIQFWEERKRMDYAVMERLSIPFDIYDVSQENWDSLIDDMVEHILETPEKRRARIYPVILSEYNPAWPEWYAEEKINLERLIGTENIVRISHYGSTSVPGLTAKPTVDILLEIKKDTDLFKLIDTLSSSEYICLNPPDMPTPPPHLMFLKGYLSDGFAEKVYHIHVRYPNNWDELYFRDYLITHPEAAAEYAELKRSLFKEYEHNRDGYTNAKSEFIKRITKKAREEFRI